MSHPLSPPSNRDHAAPSVFAQVLGLSGFLGLAAGLGLESYRLVALDQVFGTGAVPAWLETVRFAILAGSLVVVVYAMVLDELFHGWLDVVTICALLGQWGVPLSLYLDARTVSAANPFGLFGLICAGLFVAVGTAVVVNYARRSWPAPTRPRARQ